MLGLHCCSDFSLFAVNGGLLASIRQMSRQVSRGSAGDYQADEQAGVAGLSWRVSGRLACRCRAGSLASIRQMSRQRSHGPLAIIRQMCTHVSRGSVGECQPDEQAGVAGLRRRVSDR